jgi:hypothetical protein
MYAVDELDRPVRLNSIHDSTFECVAESVEHAIEQVGLDEEHSRTLEYLRR